MHVQAECHVKEKGDFEDMVEKLGNPGNCTRSSAKTTTHASSTTMALTAEKQ